MTSNECTYTHPGERTYSHTHAGERTSIDRGDYASSIARGQVCRRQQRQTLRADQAQQTADGWGCMPGRAAGERARAYSREQRE